MTFFETFAAVFIAQLLAFISQDLITKYIKPHWEKTHDHATNVVQKIFKNKNGDINVK